jgi:hypothetical protein
MTKTNLYFLRPPQKHKCREIFEEKRIPVNEKILSMKDYPVYYCSKCEIYKFNKYESKNPEVIGDFIMELQAQTNLKHNNSIYTKSYLEKITKQLE